MKVEILVSLFLMGCTSIPSTQDRWYFNQSASVKSTSSPAITVERHDISFKECQSFCDEKGRKAYYALLFSKTKGNTTLCLCGSLPLEE